MKRKIIGLLAVVAIFLTGCLREEEEYISKRQEVIEENTEENQQNEEMTTNQQAQTENTAREDSQEREEREDKTLRVTVDQLNLRDNPSTDATVIAPLTLGMEVRVLEEEASRDESGIWSRIEVNGQEGYVAREFLGE